MKAKTAVLVILAAILASSCGFDGSNGLKTREDVESIQLNLIMSNTWYMPGQFGFSLANVVQVKRRADLDNKPLMGAVLVEVKEGYIDLAGTTYFVYFGVTPVDFYNAPAWSVIWALHN